MLNVLGMVLSVLVLSSCDFGSSKGVKSPYNDMISRLEVDYKENPTDSNKFRLMTAKAIQESSEDLIKKVNKTKTFSRRYYAIESNENVNQRLEDMKQRVLKTIKTCEDQSLDIQKKIYLIGQKNYMAGKEMTLTNAREEAISSEVLTLFSLQYMKRVYEACSSVTFHYMNEFSVEEYDQSPSAIATREKLLKHFFGLVGMLKVIQNDSMTVVENIEDLMLTGTADEAYIKLVDNLALKMLEHTSSLQEFSDEIVQNGISSELQDAYNKLQTQSDLNFKNKSILYNPANPDHAILHMLVILSNLTWGSIQSSIGLGIVLSHAIIVTPISWILKPFMGSRIRLLRGPSISVANNNMQLYANVCGFPAIPSKMSMGIWELDFCTGKRFASGHEGGHAKQSALLGPLYLPAAILSYTLNLGHGGFIESWATNWAVNGRFH